MIYARTKRKYFKEPSMNFGVNVPSFLLLAFILLKVTNYITISWFWVLSPLWIPILAVGALFVFILLTLFIAEVTKGVISYFKD